MLDSSETVMQVKEGHGFTLQSILMNSSCALVGISFERHGFTLQIIFMNSKVVGLKKY